MAETNHQIEQKTTELCRATKVDSTVQTKENRIGLSCANVRPNYLGKADSK